MISKSSLSTLLIFISSIWLGVFSTAQIAIPDSVIKDKTIAYGSQPEWMGTNATISVTGSKLLNSFTNYLPETLNGRLPGLTMKQGSETIYDRGLNTFGTGRSVLVLVDGVESSFRQLVPDEIESVTLLKDASALAIYGSRGANGVLLVTTRRGKEGPLKITLSTQQGFINQPQELPAKFLGSYDYARLYNEAMLNDNPAATVRYDAAALEAYRTNSDPVFFPDVNWYDEIFNKSAMTSNYDLNFTGGTKAVKYFVALNYLNWDGLLKKTAKLSDNSVDQKNSRINFRSNIDVSLSNSITATFLLGGSIENTSNPDYKPALYTTIPPLAFPVRNPDGKSWGGNSLFTNPVGDIWEDGFFTTNSSTIQTSFKLTDKLDFITEGLSTSVLISFNNSYTGTSNKTRTYARYGLTKDVSGNIVYNKIGQPTSLVSAESVSALWTNKALQAFLNYNHSFGNDKVDAMLMWNNETYSTLGLVIPYKYIGLGGRFTYAMNEKYIGELSFAYNGSENFPKGSRWGFFPSASLGWILSNENFLKGNNILNFLKLRGSYGLTGNDDIGGTRFMFNPTRYSSSSYILGTSNTSLTALFQGAPSNTDATWEKEKKMNIGFEATILRDFDVSLDIFKNDRFDILAKPNETVPDYLGFTLPDYNIGKTNNKGFEAMIRYNNNQSKDFKFYIETNAWYARNEIVDMGEPVKAEEWLKLTGRQIGQPLLLEATGFFNTPGDIASSSKPIFSSPKVGDISYKNQNSDNIIDQKDFIPMGKSDLPELTIGFETGAEYKGFDIAVLIQGVSGCSNYLSGLYYEAFQNNGKISDVALGRWTPETATTATYPRLSAINNQNNYQQSSFWQRDGSYIKLRSIELGYTINEGGLKKILLSKARIFVNGTNLLSFEHLDFAKPESLSLFPRARTFSAGIRVQF